MEREDLKELIISNQNLIYSIASKFKGDKEDLFQAGVIGFLDAYKNYKKDSKTKFTTYAYPYIFGEIYKYVLKNKNIKVSADAIKLNTAINRAFDFLSQQYGREPTYKEVANFLEIPAFKLAEVINSLEVASLDDDRGEVSLYDYLESPTIPYDDLILLRDALEKLEPQERELIGKRYFYNMTQSEIAKQQGLNQVKVSREEVKVLSKLRSYM